MASIFDLSLLKILLINLSYYLIFALVLVWVITLIKAYRSCAFHFWAFFKLHKRAFFLILLLTSLVFFFVPKYFRVLGDEAILLSVSRSMTYEKTVSYVTEGFWHDGKIEPVRSIVEIRPFLFPFFTHMLHTVLSYRPENVFVLNCLSLGGMLFCVYLLLRPYIEEIWVFLSIILIVSQPIICLSATSGSYEIFNSFFIALSLLSLRWFMTTRLPMAFTVLFLNLIMLANIRQESIIFLLSIMFLLGLTGYFKKETFTSPVFIAAPFFLMPWAIQRVFSFIHHGAMVELGYRWTHRTMHFNNIGPNMFWFFHHICDPSGSLGYAGVLNGLGIACFVLFIVMLVLHEDEKEHQRSFFLIALIVLFIHFIIMVSYYGDIKSYSMNGRYYFPFIILFSIFPAIAGNFLWKNRFGFIGGVLMTLACFFFYFPKATGDVLLSKLPRVQESIYMRNFLNKNADQNMLIICNAPSQVIIYKQSAITFATAINKKEEILDAYKKHIFSNIFVFQEISEGSSKEVTKNFDAVFPLEILDQVKFGYFSLKVSRVKD
jgi:hypothetical protein